MGWFDRPEFGANVGLIDEIYRRYLDDPASVSEAWRDFFTHEVDDQDPAAGGDASTPAAEAEPATRSPSSPERNGTPGNGAAATLPKPPARERPEPDSPMAPTTRPSTPANGSTSPLRGAAARVVSAMEESLQVPTATSVRVVPAKNLEVNRLIVNNYLSRARAGKVSFTHVIAYAVLKGLAAVPAMTSIYAEVDGKPRVLRPEHVNLGLAVDAQRESGRTLLVPNIKEADTLSFSELVGAYESIVRRALSGDLPVADFQGTTVTVTNPGTIGTVLSVPRLLRDQAAIIGVGSIGYPAEYQAADPKRLADLGVGKVITLTSTYDHRVIQGAESGEFLAKVHQLLLGDEGFYDDIFASVGVPYVPSRWLQDSNPAPESLDAVEKAARVLQLINMYRVRGHLMADLDPLDVKPPQMHPELDPAHFGLSIWDLDRWFATGGLAGRRELPLGDILGILRDAYCRTSTVEYMHISEPDEKQWIQERVEVKSEPYTKHDHLHVLTKLNEAEAFERFLHNKYVGHKRFSLEGAESLILMLDTVLSAAADADLEEVVIGMSHRGRLNVLANTVGKSYGEIFNEFEGSVDPTSSQGSGDVKYHLGATGKHTSPSGAEIGITLASNPSHLESVNPVVEGIARAKQDQLGRDGFPVLPVLIHGDAAFAGQGVVAETLSLSQLPGYRTGGTVHIVVNNQVGFTTTPNYGRSSHYATDVAKMIQAPIFHVNGDDPEACVRVTKLAFEFRQAFRKDVVIDMWCYRRFGHNEADEPSFTQPLMYQRIVARPSVRKLYTEALVKAGELSIEEAERALEDFRAKLQQAFQDTRGGDGVHRQERITPAPDAGPPERTGVARETLDPILEVLSTVPESFHLHKKLTKLLDERKTALDRDAVDWGMAEALALGSLLQDGRTVRLTGQDTRRGTFSHRHGVLVDQVNGEQYVSLAHLGAGHFILEDSLLSEFAAMGFEYGYSVGDPDALVLWEAQFGDFANGAQIIVDQFITAAEDKWGQKSSLTLLLPHGYEGQGPEHSSARIERFLQLAAHDNMRVVTPSTPGQYFHLLRRQALWPVRKPLVVVTPKSLLRLPAARSSATAITGGRFEPVLADPLAPDPGKVRRVLVCSGKVTYDLERHRKEQGTSDVAVVRLEQLYPFPVDALASELGRYESVQPTWVQEEPENMGSWRFVDMHVRHDLGLELELVARAEAAAPATGSHTVHVEEQQKLVEDAFAGA